MMTIRTYFGIRARGVASAGEFVWGVAMARGYLPSRSRKGLRGKV